MAAPTRSDTFDVAILGAGIAGSAMAAILARQGVRTVLIDAGSHPRFSIGESTIPTTSLMWDALGRRYGVEALCHLAGYTNVSQHISRSCGVKKTFSFVLHEDDAEPARHAAYQLGIAPVGGYEVHMFRQDVDAYVFAAAVRLGAEPRQRTRVAGIDYDDDGATLRLEQGEPLRARFVVDATGPGSPFARALGLRAKEAELKTRTRSMFTHMVDVPRYDDLLPHPVAPAAVWEGTLHHLFDGGWFWVIPFDNADESLNSLVSVGLTLDLDQHPVDDADPETTFHRIAARFPSVARHFAGARAVRPWVSTRRLQWSSTRTIAPRYAMMASTAGFVGPLFSLGLGHTAEAIAWLAPRIIDAVREDDFAESRFEAVDDTHRRLIEMHDELVHGAFVSFREPELWDAWFRVWAVTQLPREMAIITAMSETETRGERAAWATFESAWAEHPMACAASEVFGRAIAIKDAVAEGRADATTAARQIRALLDEVDLGPLGDVVRRERHLLVPGRRHKALFSAMRWLVSKERTPDNTTTWRRFVRHVARVNAAG